MRPVSDSEELARALRLEGYAPDGPGFPSWRRERLALPLVTRGGARVVAKVYPAREDAERTFASMRELWRSSFGERRRPPGLPEPVDCLPELRVVVMERLDGERLADARADDAHAFDAVVRLAASLHASDARPAKRRDARRVARSVRRKAEDVARVDATLGREVARVADRLEAATPGEPELVPSHGDLGPANVLIRASGPALVDFDRLQVADPLRDLTYLGGWYCVRALQRDGRPDWTMLRRAIEVYSAERALEPGEERVGFHRAAALMRFAHDRVRRGEPGLAALLPRLVEEALAGLP